MKKKKLQHILRNYDGGIITSEECYHQILDYFLWKNRNAGEVPTTGTVTRKEWKGAKKQIDLTRRVIGLKKRDIISAMMDRVIAERSK